MFCWSSAFYKSSMSMFASFLFCFVHCGHLKYWRVFSVFNDSYILLFLFLSFINLLVAWFILFTLSKNVACTSFLLSYFDCHKVSFLISLLQILDSHSNGLCLYILDVLCFEEGIWDNYINEIAVYCFRTSTSRSIYGNRLIFK